MLSVLGESGLCIESCGGRTRHFVPAGFLQLQALAFAPLALQLQIANERAAALVGERNILDAFLSALVLVASDTIVNSSRVLGLDAQSAIFLLLADAGNLIRLITQD